MKVGSNSESWKKKKRQYLDIKQLGIIFVLPCNILDRIFSLFDE